MKSMSIAIAISAAMLIGGYSIGYCQGIEVGKSEYINSCAACHGTGGKGDGPIAASLRRMPVDLTGLSDRNHGVFPFARVYDVIDGRFEVATHGKREMPVWGEAFQPVSGATQLTGFMSKEIVESIVRARILALIDYIFSLQAPSKP
jgi:hypothetical protein